ncbi:unnamed protein product [Toxocara canis]|nr:unnamed protein product [Toxocara canis]
MMRACGFMRTFCTEAVAATSHASNFTQHSISIPKAIKRSPTDLLKALSETVGVDTTAPHFAFIDDPATIPTTAQMRKSYYLAKELGRRAARQLAAEWPTLFMYDRDEPRLEAFRPKAVPNPMTVEPTTEMLRELIEKKEVSSAVKLYERIRSENVEVAPELQMELFRLVVYYNGDDIPFSEIEEWHGWRNFVPEETPKHWQQAGLADLLFETLEKSEEVCSLMICGLCKYPSDEAIDRAISLYNDMLQKKQLPSVEAFSGLICTARSYKEGQVYLEQMVKLGVKPTIGVFNGLLGLVLKDKKVLSCRDQAEKILREAIVAECEPTLRTFSLILKSADGDERHDKEIALAYVEQMLTELENRSTIETVERGDQRFFVDVMNVATGANNRALADRIEALYRSDKNNAKMPAFTDESLFYSHYLMLLIKQLPIEELENRYRALVPRVVGVNRTLAIAMINRLQAAPRWSLLRRVIEDGIAARHMTDLKVSTLMRSILLSLKLQEMTIEEREECTELVRRMVDIWIEYSNFTTPNALRLQQKFTPSAISECSMLLIKLGDRERGWDLLKLLLDENARSGETPTVTEFGYPQPAIMRSLMEEALQNGDWLNASQCLNIIAVYSPQTRLEPFVEQIVQRCRLSALQKRILNNFVRLRQ